jgi:6-phosphogluconolactonase
MRPFLLLFFVLAMVTSGLAVRAAESLAFVGTYTNAKSKGIYAFRVQAVREGATLAPLGLAVETPSPSFLAIDARRKLLFAVNETNQFEGARSGAISTFSIDPATGKLTLLSQKPTNGTAPCHLMLDRDGRHVIIANYGTGSVAVYRIEADGKLGAMTAFVEHRGSSVHQRQRGPHAHCVTLDPGGRFVYICDLGLDQVLAYALDPQSGKLTPASPAFTSMQPGAGPRHMVFRPDGKFAYVVNELNSTVTVLAAEAGSAKLTEVQTVTTLPADFTGTSTCAEIQVHPSGRFVYASNRGHDSLAIFEVDSAKGTLRPVGHHLTGGKTPRHFDFNPAGTHLFAANQNSDTIQISAFDATTGKLQPARSLVEAPTPVCVAFYSEP